VAAPNALILTPLLSTDLVQSGDSAALQYVLRVTSGASTANLNFPSSGSLTSSRYYWTSGNSQADASTDGGVGDLVKMLQATLNTNTGGLTYTVTLDIANDRITISATGGNFSILWPHASTTLNHATFGFANSNTASGSSVSGTLLPRGIWRPKVPYQRDSRDWQPKVGGLAIALSGKMRGSNLTSPKKERDIGFGLMVESKVLDEYVASPDQVAFESHWLNSIQLGRALRLYDDEVDVTDSAEVRLYKARSFAKPVQRSGETPELITRWDVDLSLVRAES
jgi:hypothetical protein